VHSESWYWRRKWKPISKCSPSDLRQQTIWSHRNSGTERGSRGLAKGFIGCHGTDLHLPGASSAALKNLIKSLPPLKAIAFVFAGQPFCRRKEASGIWCIPNTPLEQLASPLLEWHRRPCLEVVVFAVFATAPSKDLTSLLYCIEYHSPTKFQELPDIFIYRFDVVTTSPWSWQCWML